MSALTEGQAVAVLAPHKDCDGEWLLPGERLYVVEVRGERVRVRCPATGADCWVEAGLLSAVPVGPEPVGHETWPESPYGYSMWRDVELGCPACLDACPLCGALVDYWGQETHKAWHVGDTDAR